MRPRMDRWAAADLLRELTSERFGSVEQAVAAGLALRHDGGPCFRADHDQTEIEHREIARSPAYHYEPQNRRLHREVHPDAQGQILWIARFVTLDAPRYRTPRETREHLIRQPAIA